MSEAVAIAGGGATAASVDIVVGGWLRMTLLGDSAVLHGGLRAASETVARRGTDGAPNARVHIFPAEWSAPRWLDRSPSAAVVDWHNGSEARVQLQWGDGILRWSGRSDDVLTAELRLDTDVPAAFSGAMKLLTVMLGVVHKRRVLLHASAVLLDGHAVVFLGESGAGKSTTAERLEAEGLTRIADDVVFVEAGDPPRVMPYFGDRLFHALDDPAAGYPLAGVFPVRKNAAASRVERSAPRSVAMWLASVVVPPGPPAYSSGLVELAGELAAHPVRPFSAAVSGPLVPALRSVEGL